MNVLRVLSTLTIFQLFEFSCYFFSFLLYHWFSHPHTSFLVLSVVSECVIFTLRVLLHLNRCFIFIRPNLVAVYFSEIPNKSHWKSQEKSALSLLHFPLCLICTNECRSVCFWINVTNFSSSHSMTILSSCSLSSSWRRKKLYKTKTNSKRICACINTIFNAIFPLNRCNQLWLEEWSKKKIHAPHSKKLWNSIITNFSSFALNCHLCHANTRIFSSRFCQWVCSRGKAEKNTTHCPLH